MRRVVIGLVGLSLCLCSEGATSFRWGFSGCSLPGLALGSTVLSFTAPTTGASHTWDASWADSTDGGFYGGSVGQPLIYSAPNLAVDRYWTLFYSGSGDGLYVYAVVLNVPYTTFQSTGIPDGTQYAITSLNYGPLPSSVPPSSPLAINGEALAWAGTVSVVPEPTTMALLVTGLGLVLMRRRIKNASVESR